jgi:alpha-glucosidase
VLQFLSEVPTVWDETRALDGKVGDYALVARRKGETWYVGAITDWTGREVSLDFSFLGDGNYTLEIFADGPNANRVGSDYIKNTRQITKNDKLTIQMAPGGGWVGIITPAR